MQVLMRPISIPESEYRPLKKPLDVDLGEAKLWFYALRISQLALLKPTQVLS